MIVRIKYFNNTEILSRGFCDGNLRMANVGVKWSLIVSLLFYAGLIISRNTRLAFNDSTLRDVRNCCEYRTVDISESRLSNFGSDSGPNLDTSAMLIDRVIPLTKTLNRFVDSVLRKFALTVELDNNKIITLKNDVFNLTFFEAGKEGETKRDVFGMDIMISALNSLRRLGNAYISLNTESDIVIIQKLRFDILKYKYDYYDNTSAPAGRSSFIYTKNTFLLNLTLLTSYDNSLCKLKSVDFAFLPIANDYTLKVEGLIGTSEFYNKLKSALYDNFVSKVLPAVRQVVLPTLRDIIYKADICSYFDARPNTIDKDTVNSFTLSQN